MLLSFDRGSLNIAYIEGGKYDKCVLKIFDPTKDKDVKKKKKKVRFDGYDIEDEYPVEFVNDLFFKEELGSRFNRDTKFNKIDRLRKALHKGTAEDIPEELLMTYHKAKKVIEDKSRKEVSIDPGVVVPLPLVQPNMVQHIFIAGNTGCGKSTWVGNYVRMYNMLFPKRPVYLFSRLNDDPALDKYDIQQIELDKDLVKNPTTGKELTEESDGALVIFDDTNTIPDEKINKTVHKIREDLLECGRHENITVITTGHMICDYKKTRNILNECSGLVLFPQSGGQYHITRCLKVYCGLTNDVIQKILKLNSRWIYVNKNVPNYVLYQHGAFILS